MRGSRVAPAKPARDPYQDIDFTNIFSL